MSEVLGLADVQGEMLTFPIPQISLRITGGSLAAKRGVQGASFGIAWTTP